MFRLECNYFHCYLYFVGDGTPAQVKEETFKAMRLAINCNSPYTGYVSKTL
jgi:hypothetical protein